MNDLAIENNYTCMHDVIAKKILTSRVIGKKYAAAIISELTGIDADELRRNIEFLYPEVGVNADVIQSRVDIALQTGKKIINIEVNRSKGSYTNNKNKIYLCQLILGQISSYKDYDKLQPVTQINIDEYDYFNDNKLIYHCMIMETTLHKIADKNLEIFHLNIPKLSQLGYNEISNDRLKRLLYIFACDDEDLLDKLYEGDDLMEKVKEEVKRISGNIDWDKLYYDQDEIDRLNREEAIREGFETGIKEGIEKGIQEGLEKGIQEGLEKGIQEGREKGIQDKSIEVAKKMLNKKMDINLISEVTNLSKKELEKLKKSL